MNSFDLNATIDRLTAIAQRKYNMFKMYEKDEPKGFMAVSYWGEWLGLVLAIAELRGVDEMDVYFEFHRDIKF